MVRSTLVRPNSPPTWMCSTCIGVPPKGREEFTANLGGYWRAMQGLEPDTESQLPGPSPPAIKPALAGPGEGRELEPCLLGKDRNFCWSTNSAMAFTSQMCTRDQRNPASANDHQIVCRNEVG